MAGFGFRAVGCDDDRFAIDACVRDGVVDVDRILLEVNGFPPKPQHLTTAQAEKRGDVDEQPQLVIGSFLDQLRKLLLGVERTFIAFSRWRIDFIHRVVRNLIHTVCVFQEAVHQGGLMTDGGGRKRF